MKECISDLILKADGLKEDAYNKRARIIRGLDNRNRYCRFRASLSGNLEADIACIRKMW
jgi:hypothetical protein